MRALTRTLLAAAVALLALLPRTGQARPSGALSIDNQRRDTLTVQVDDWFLGTVSGRSQGVFPVPVGRHQVEVRIGRELLARRIVEIGRGRSASISFAPPTGQILLDNHSGTRLSVSIDGRRSLELHDGEHRSLTLDAGRHTVVATYVQLGQVRTLRSDSLRLDEGEQDRIRLEPVRFGLVEVRNRTGRAAELFVDADHSAGRSFGTLRSGESRVVELPLGSARIRLVDSRRGFTLEEKRMVVRAYADQRVTVDAPRVGLASLRNEGGATLSLFVDGVYLETLRPFEREQVELNVGFHRLELRDHRGRIIQKASVTVSPYDMARVDFDRGGRDRDDDRDHDVASHHRGSGHNGSGRSGHTSAHH